MESLTELLLAFCPEFLAVLIAIPAGLWADRRIRSRAKASEQRESQQRAAKHLGIIQEEIQDNLKSLKDNEREQASRGKLVPEFSLHIEGWLVVREAASLVDHIDVDLIRDLTRYYNTLTDAARLRDLVHRITLAHGEEMTQFTKILLFRRLGENLRTARRNSESLLEVLDTEIARLATLTPQLS